VFFLIAAIASLMIFPTVGFAQDLRFEVTDPKLAWGQRSPIIANETALVWANVTSRFPVLNVTLRYAETKSETPPPLSRQQYHIIMMNRIHGSEFNGTYEAVMPHVENDTLVWGFATAFDDHGNIVESPSGPQQIYQAMTPNPDSSYLDFSLLFRHVDAKTMTIDVTFSAVLRNALSYSAEILSDGSRGFQITVNKPVDKYTYSSEYETTSFWYSTAHPEFYPFDHYNYTLRLALPEYLNQSAINLGYGTRLAPGTVYIDFVPVSPRNLTEKSDNSAWEIHSRVQYFASANFTAEKPSLVITILLQRQQEYVNYLLLVPALSLYALLGFSVILRGREELRNRLLLYLNVFVFSYGFQSSIGRLPITPMVSGFSMMDRIVLTLIPCTALLAVSSIVGTVLTRWRDSAIELSHFSWLSACDIIGVAASTFILSQSTLVTVREYLTERPWVKDVTYGLWDLDWRGGLFFLLLLSGLVFNLVFVTVREHKSFLSKIWHGKGMREEDKRSLALLFAGTLLGLIPSALVLAIRFEVEALLVVVLVLCAVVLLFYGVGTLQDVAHERRLRNRWKTPVKIGILNDMEWDAGDPETHAWTDVPPMEWRSAIQSCASSQGLDAEIELANVRSRFDSYVALVNPYGGVYPEEDLKEFATLSKITRFVQEGGLFVNIADVPSYWAYNPHMHRKLDIAQTVYGEVQESSAVRIFHYKPFELVPLVKQLGLRVIGTAPKSSNLEKILGRPANVTFRRAAIVDPNVTACVEPQKLPYLNGAPHDMVPIFTVQYGEGDFLISLVWITDEAHDEDARRAIKNAICRATVDKIAQKIRSR